jgi:glycosyltransferase involved in cell wall biosynthesis
MLNSLVSVIIPTYNREVYLSEAIQSVVRQSYTNIEIIVVDDGSNINYAQKICDKFENCFYFYKVNGGLSSARNYGIRKSKGNFIAFLDDDDFWREDKIEKQLLLLEKYPDIDCIHSSAMIVDDDGNSSGIIIGASSKNAHKRSGYVFWNAIGGWAVKSPTPLIRKKVFQKDLMFDESIKVGEDIDFYHRMFFRHKVLYIDEPLAFYRDHQDKERLSLQEIKYLGIEKKIFANLKNMGISNVFILHRIAIYLVKSSLRRWNEVHPERPKKINMFLLRMRPIYYLNNI